MMGTRACVMYGYIIYRYTYKILYHQRYWPYMAKLYFVQENSIESFTR